MAVSKPEHLPPEETPHVSQYPGNQPYSPPAYQPGGQPGYQGQYPVGAPVQPPVITHQPAVTNTTMVVNQQQIVLQKSPRNWSTGLCGCFEDCGSLCMAMCCPCMLLNDVASRMGEGCCFVYCCPAPLLGLRIKLRVQENIEGSLMNDYFEVQCCPLCVLCQLSRELKHISR